MLAGMGLLMVSPSSSSPIGRHMFRMIGLSEWGLMGEPDYWVEGDTGLPIWEGPCMLDQGVLRLRNITGTGGYREHEWTRDGSCEGMKLHRSRGAGEEHPMDPTALLFHHTRPDISRES